MTSPKIGATEVFLFVDGCHINVRMCHLQPGASRARRVAVKAMVVKLNPQRGAARGRQYVSAWTHTCVTSNGTA